MFKDDTTDTSKQVRASGVAQTRGANVVEPEGSTNTIAVPTISLPKGGGAIRGIGEKFAANPVTGTGSMTVPIATSPGRLGFGPQLSLSYDSSSGNGPFGFGWSLSIPSIKRKTDKGLPQYHDASESDVYILSGAEDLVPVFRNDPDGQWVAARPGYRRDAEGWVSDEQGRLVLYEEVVEGYQVRRYRPRVEGLFARIERWTQLATGTVHWRSVTRENVTTIYGRNNDSRIFDPAEAPSLHPRRTFEWLTCESYDDKGNAVVYEYASENDVNVNRMRSNERNRVRTANRYLKRIKYGNSVSRVVQADLSQATWLFEVVFDYEEGHVEELPRDLERSARAQHRLVRASADSHGTWSERPDPFSNYRAGFEVRTYRRCRRVMMFHRLEELGPDPYLVRSTEFDYEDLDISQTVSVEREVAHQGSTRFASFIRRVLQSGYVRDDARPTESRDGLQFSTYLQKSLPPLEFEYSKAQIQHEVLELDEESQQNLPNGLDGSVAQWVDLDGEGVSGVLTKQAGAWFYKPNLGGGKLGAAQVLRTQPSLFAQTASGEQLLDLSGAGQLDVVAFSGPTPGFYQRTRKEGWEPFRAFSKLPNVQWDDPNLRFVDLNGDGHADILITEEDALTWYPSLAEEGFEPARRVHQPVDEERGPRLVFADGTESIYLADFCGDGLTDVVRIRNGEVCYWPNLGYGRFAAKVTMDNGPWFDDPDQFDQRRIRLADIDGSGTVDILYLHRDGVRLYFNQSGNRWSDAHHLPRFPQVDNLSSVSTADLLGNGTAFLIWSSPLPADARRPVRYVDLMGGQKPHLLVKAVNNLGAETHITYVSSTKFYLEDKRDGKPWITLLPFPVHCVAKVAVSDRFRGTRFSTTYSYHHGYFDGVEREFRGFGRVEQIDVEHFGEFLAGNAASPYVTDDHQLYQPPVKTVTWYHTGAFADRRRILAQFEHEYFPRSFAAANPGAASALETFSENVLPEPELAAEGLTAVELREGLRACKGMPLRQEIYELDADALAQGQERAVKLFSTAYHNCHVRCLQRCGDHRHAVFLVAESEAITYHYELALSEPTVGNMALQADPRVAHTLNLNVDEYGHVLQSVAVVYPRLGRHRDDLLPLGAEDLIARVQSERHLTYTETRYTDDVDHPNDYRLRVPCEVSTYELTGISPASGPYFTLEELQALRLSDVYQGDGLEVAQLEYHERPQRTSRQKRSVERVRTLFFNADLMRPLPFGRLGRLGLPYESYKLALTETLLDVVFTAGQLTDDVRAALGDSGVSGYLSGGPLRDVFPERLEQYWAHSGVAGFDPATAVEQFYHPTQYTDPFGKTTRLRLDRYGLFPESTTDPLDNTVRVLEFDYRVLAPRLLQDINDNVSETMFDAFGLPAAVALKGKGTEGDHLDGFEVAVRLVSSNVVSRLFTGTYNAAEIARLLGTATVRHLYWFGESVAADGAVSYGTSPAGACTIARETHVAELAEGESTRFQVTFEYSDGSGNALVTKALAEPAPGQTTPRWVTSGKTILNNKGNPVKQYEPYFSSNEHRFEETEAVGVTQVLYYDAPGRVIRTELPDGTYSRVEFSPWHVASFDANDTVLEAGNTWYAARVAAGVPPEKLQAAIKAAVHAATPATVFLDSLGRGVISVAHNRVLDREGAALDEKYVTFTRLDTEGKPLYIRDARGNRVMQYITPALPEGHDEEPDAGFAPCYDIVGNLLFQHSMDGGDRWMLPDASGQALFGWDINDRLLDSGSKILEHRVSLTTYDELRRPLEQRLRTADASWPLGGDAWHIVSRIVYGDTRLSPTDSAPAVPEASARNLRGQVFQHFDPSGCVTNVRCDFQGNPLEVERRLIREVEAPVIDWSGAAVDDLLEDETFKQRTNYDALGRILRLFNWHRGDEAPVVYEPRYNERGLLAGEDVIIRGRRVPALSGIQYNAKRQRERIQYGNGTITRHHYDPLSFRLRQIRTARPNYEPRFPEHRSGLVDANVLQQLHYTYDAVGNITQIYDEAYEPEFFAQQMVEARSQYTYDAIYRLVQASGRENQAALSAPSRIENTLEPSTFPQQANALRNYVEHYTYDAAGNILQLAHRVRGVSQPEGAEWTRHYQYDETSNRLIQSWLGNRHTGADITEYHYDRHGSMANFENVAAEHHVRWDYRDMIRSMHLGGGGWAYYSYDFEKRRTRKVIRRTDGSRWERLYLGGMELYRSYAADGKLQEEIKTHHLFIDDERVLILDDVIATTNRHLGTEVLYRYQYGNHLGSVALELDGAVEVISYEEYHPYGTAAYRAVGRGVRATRKRHRYTGMERDEETGLSYHTARYYLPWLARWSGSDPIGITGGLNIHAYLSNPIRSVDTAGTQEQPRVGFVIPGRPGPPVVFSVVDDDGHHLFGVPPSTSPPPQPTATDVTTSTAAPRIDRDEAMAILEAELVSAGLGGLDDPAYSDEQFDAMIGELASDSRGLDGSVLDAFVGGLATGAAIGIGGAIFVGLFPAMVPALAVFGVLSLAFSFMYLIAEAGHDQQAATEFLAAEAGGALGGAGTARFGVRIGTWGRQSLPRSIRARTTCPGERIANRLSMLERTLPPDALRKVPQEWGEGILNQRGVGIRWADPANPKRNLIRIDIGNPLNSQATQSVDHVRVTYGGRVIGRGGQVVEGTVRANAEETHIPLSEWLQWSTWFAP